jgi:hypothetical protein
MFMEGLMIQPTYPYNTYPMTGMNPQMLQTGPMQNQSQFLVPGLTAGTTSPGGFGAYSAGSPPPPAYGVNLPTAQAAQLYSLEAQAAAIEEQEQFPMAPGSPRPLGIEYTQGFLRSQIGQNVRVEFLIGISSLMDRRGTLLEVGIDYIILREEQTDDLLYCDIYSIKFVTIYK